MTDPTELTRVYDVLLAPSFPPAELEPLGWLTDGVAAGRVRVLAVTDDDGQPAAAAVTERLEPSPVVLLTYFAARADQRGRGVGTALYREAIDQCVLHDDPALVVAEVERPDRHRASAEHGDPAARLRFYDRLGARVLDLPYFQPPLGPDTPPVHGLLLLALWVRPGLLAPDRSGLTDQRALVAAVDAILDGAPDSPEAHRLRAAARARTVRLLPVADYAQVASSR